MYFLNALKSGLSSPSSFLAAVLRFLPDVARLARLAAATVRLDKGADARNLVVLVVDGAVRLAILAILF